MLCFVVYYDLVVYVLFGWGCCGDGFLVFGGVVGGGDVCDVVDVIGCVGYYGVVWCGCGMWVLSMCM